MGKGPETSRRLQAKVGERGIRKEREEVPIRKRRGFYATDATLRGIMLPTAIPQQSLPAINAEKKLTGINGADIANGIPPSSQYLLMKGMRIMQK